MPLPARMLSTCTYAVTAFYTVYGHSTRKFWLDFFGMARYKTLVDLIWTYLTMTEWPSILKLLYRS